MTIYKEFCVYLTKYAGNKLPPLYIGSRATIDVLENGYFGSVTSMQYKKIWQEELKQHPELFSIEIISCHDTRQDALNAEEALQRKNNVVSSPMYINQSYANKHFSNKGNIASLETRQKMSESRKGKKFTLEHRENLSAARKGKPGLARSEETRQKMSESHKGKHTGSSNNFYGRTHSEETKQKISESSKKRTHSVETKKRIGEARKLAWAKKSTKLLHRSQ
jgi:hypothetical protein